MKSQAAGFQKLTNQKEVGGAENKSGFWTESWTAEKVQFNIKEEETLSLCVLSWKEESLKSFFVLADSNDDFWPPGCDAAADRVPRHGSASAGSAGLWGGGRREESSWRRVAVRRTRCVLVWLVVRTNTSLICIFLLICVSESTARAAITIYISRLVSGTYIPRKEVAVLETIKATVIRENQAIRLRARKEGKDRTGVNRVTGNTHLWAPLNCLKLRPQMYPRSQFTERKIKLNNFFLHLAHVELICFPFFFSWWFWMLRFSCIL